jgi:peptidyl-prolyl cis-trans isomerase B (cyclophilin B)
MQKDMPKSGETIAVMKTSLGVMKFRLFENEIPNGVKNFVTLSEEGKYDGCKFHRIVKNFVVQGGDFTRHDGTGGHSWEGLGKTIDDEYHEDLTHIRGALSYAKTQAPKSIGSQFFIVYPKDGTHFLDHPKGGRKNEGYTVFGQLFEGFETLDAIAGTKTHPDDSPVEDVIIQEVCIQKMA